MSSHKEAPESSKDPVADNTDVSAFVTPDKPSTVTLIANYIPFQIPQGGPNFAEFGEDVRYDINISNRGTAQPDISYQFRFTTAPAFTNSFLYNSTPIKDVAARNWRYQTYTVTKVSGGKSTVIAKDLLSPPVNVGLRSTPNYANLIKPTIHTVGSRKFFAGQRAEGFYVDLGSIFDLGALRPLNAFHLIKEHPMMGIDGTKNLNVHTIAIQVPISELNRYGKKSVNPASADATIGVWATANRQKARTFDASKGKFVASGPFVQVSRLGNPLINEVINGVGQKDYWNAQPPKNDKKYIKNYEFPGLSALLPVLYPKVFPKLAAYNTSKKPRVDLVAILLLGIPKGVIKGFQNNTGKTNADMLRLNMGFKPAKKQNALGLLGKDTAGFPNGRRVNDNVVAIELLALAGATLPLVDKTFVPDAAVSFLKAGDGTRNSNSPYLTTFPFLGTPAGGYQSTPGTPKTS